MRSSNSRRHPQRSFPEWTPPCIRDLAQILYNDAKRHKVRAKDEKSFYRVTLDPRMKRVWDELLKKKRLKTEKRNSTYILRQPLTGANGSGVFGRDLCKVARRNFGKEARAAKQTESKCWQHWSRWRYLISFLDYNLRNLSLRSKG